MGRPTKDRGCGLTHYADRRVRKLPGVGELGAIFCSVSCRATNPWLGRCTFWTGAWDRGVLPAAFRQPVPGAATTRL